MKADMEANEKLSPIVTQLFLRGRVFKILHIFTSQFYFKVPKAIRLNVTQYIKLKKPEKRGFNKQCKIIHLTKISESKDFMTLYKDYAQRPFSFLVNTTALPSDNPLRCRKNLL